MVIHKYINKLVNSFEKHVRVLGKICRDLYRPFKNIQ